MSIIRDFNMMYESESHDLLNGLMAASVWESLPIGVSWYFLSVLYKIECLDRLIPVQLIDDFGVALVVAPFNRDKNKALIVKPDGDVMWDVGASAKSLVGGGIFSDVYYISDHLCFFVNINNQDFRFSFDVFSGAVGALVPSY